jgi:drug/metabolite transporter (DMT)-like permease
MSEPALHPSLLIHYLALGCSIVLTALSQVLLRSGAIRAKNWASSFMNWRSLSGYFLLLIVTQLMVFAMQEIPLRTMAAWNSSTFIVVLLAAWKFLGEKISPRTMVGSAIIVLGIVVFSL